MRPLREKKISFFSVLYVGHYAQQVSWQLFHVIIPEIKSESLFPLGAYLKSKFLFRANDVCKIETVSSNRTKKDGYSMMRGFKRRA